MDRRPVTLRAFASLGAVVLAGLSAVGCAAPRAAAPSPQAIQAAIDADPIGEMSASDVVHEFKQALLQAATPQIHQVQEVTPDRYRYRHQVLIVATRDKIVYTMKIARVSVEKARWVFVFDHGGRHLDKIKCVDEARAYRLKSLLDYICSPEFKQSYDAERAVAVPPTPPPEPEPAPGTEAPCPICGDPRGDAAVCPSCGME